MMSFGPQEEPRRGEGVGLRESAQRGEVARRGRQREVRGGVHVHVHDGWGGRPVSGPEPELRLEVRYGNQLDKVPGQASNAGDDVAVAPSEARRAASRRQLEERRARGGRLGRRDILAAHPGDEARLVLRGGKKCAPSVGFVSTNILKATTRSRLACIVRDIDISIEKNEL